MLEMNSDLGSGLVVRLRFGLVLAALGFCCFPLVCDEQGLLLVAAHGLSYPEA